MPKLPEDLPTPLKAVAADERRSSRDRRRRDRREQDVGPSNGERRRGSDRRRLERRESPSGHLRNALQVLMTVASHPKLDPHTQDQLMSTTRRVMLALWEIERRQR